MEELETQSCIFCTNCFDRKPDINFVEVDTENFKEGFNLFCKLLGDNGDGGLVNDNFGGNEPCCEECFEALRNLVKLEKIIVETQQRQTEVVQLLRAVTVASADSFPKVLGIRWAQLREHLVKALQTPESESDQSSIHSIFDNNYDDNYMDDCEGAGALGASADNEFTKTEQNLPQIKNCRVSLTRISLPLKPSGGPILVGGSTDTIMGRLRPRYRPIILKKEGWRRSLRLRGDACDGDSHDTFQLNPERDVHFNNENHAESTIKRPRMRSGESSIQRITPQASDSMQIGDSTASKPVMRRFSGSCRSTRSRTRIINYKGRPRGSVKRRPEADMTEINLDNAGTITKKAIGRPYGSRTNTNRIKPQPICRRPVVRPRAERVVYKEIDSTSETSDVEGETITKTVQIQNRYNSNVTEKLERKEGRCLEYCHQRACDDLFLRLKDDLFLHKNILVAFTQNRLVCQEKDCNYGTRTEDNCVTFELFEEFRKHVNESHKLLSRHLTQTCPLCPAMFDDAKRLSFKSHLMEEHLPPAICNSCWRPFYGKGIGDMMRHAWSHKNEEEKEFAKTLGYQYPEQKAKVVKEIVDGERRVPPEKNIFCDQCPQRFAKEASFKAHQKRHLLEKLGIKKTETDFRKLQCRFCGQEYAANDRHRFDIHMRTHTGDFPFVCEICGKGFVIKDRLRVHANVHSEEPQFPCEFCGRRYKHPRNLQFHKQKEHSEMLGVMKGKRKEFIGPKIAFPCEFCDRIFPCRGPRADHVRMEHADICIVDKQGMSEVNVITE